MAAWHSNQACSAFSLTWASHRLAAIATKAPILEPYHLGTIAPDRRLAFGEMQNLGLPPSTLDLVLADASCRSSASTIRRLDMWACPPLQITLSAPSIFVTELISGPLLRWAGILMTVAEKSRNSNMQCFNWRALIIQLSEAYRH